MGKKAASRNQEKVDQVEPEKAKTEENKQTSIICGLVMPISEIDGCSAEHWVEVRDIIEEALAAIDIKTSLVSDGDEVGIIQERIVQNLYDRPIVVCDVSCKNPNVMFELGLRLAFDMPTVVIKDDKTGYSFDTSPVEHLTYRRDLNYCSIQEFKKTLSKKVLATLQKKDEDDEYSPFLKAFNKKRVSGIETNEISPLEYYSIELADLKHMVRQIISNQHIEIRESRMGYSKFDSSKVSNAITEPGDSLYQAVNFVAKGLYRTGEVIDRNEMFSMLSRQFPEVIEWYTEHQIRDTISAAMARYMS